MSDKELKPCPFCGAGTTEIRENGKIWLGMKYGEPASVSVFHHCEGPIGQPHRAIERIGKDLESAIEAWNCRAAIAAAPAQDDDALTAAYMAGRYDAKKVTRTAAPTQAGEYPELPDCGYAKSGDIKAFGTYTAVQMHAYADATCAARQAAQAQDARQPLNDEALDLMCEQALFGRISMQQFARSIESVHGIW